MRDVRRDWWDRTWKDKDGEVAVWHTPNVWLIGWAVFTTISLFVSGKAGTAIADIGLVSLAIWALLEVFKGVNYFRRFIGVLGLLVVIAFVLRAI